MTNWQRIYFMIMVMLLLTVWMHTTALAGPGEDAYDRQDYQTALKVWQPLADQGIAGAQNNIGLLYENGEGVTRDYAEAMKWFLKAADQGEAAA
jgi:TPR repeat protein